MAEQKQRVTILGGGPSGLATAFALSEPHLRDQFEVTIYQLGWRAGGHCQSGRVSPEWWVNQNGTHYLFGCYYDALYLLRQAYAELDAHDDQRFGTFREQLIDRPLVVMKQFFDGAWLDWTIEFPENDDVIGADRGAPTPLGMFEMAARTLLGSLVSGELAKKVLQLAHLDKIAHAEVATALEAATLAAEKVLEIIDNDFPSGGSLLGELARDALAVAMEALRAVLSEVLGPLSKVNVEILRLWILADLGLTILIGLLREDAVNADMVAILDQYDFREFLTKWGGSETTVQSPPVALWYDAMGAFDQGDVDKPNCAAGASLACLFQMVLAYEGCLSFQLKNEVGDSVIGPVVQALRYRGVKVVFFHRIWDMEPDGDRVARIVMERQARLWKRDDASYEPFIAPVNGRAVWPDAPLMDQVRTTYKNDPADLTSFYCARKGPDVVIEQGKDYDVLVCALTGATLKWYAEKLGLAHKKWANLLENLSSVETQGLRLWFKPTLTELGWPTDPPVLSSYVLPYATWEDPTPVLEGEDWPTDGGPQTVCHLFGPLAFPDPWPAPWETDTGKAYLAAQQARAEADATKWLESCVGALWPNATLPDDDRAIDPSKCAQPEALSTPWQVRANSGPGEAYLQLVPGTWQYRFRPTDTGFRDFFAVGDWTRTSFPCGSIEAAISSGLNCGEHIAALYARPD